MALCLVALRLVALCLVAFRLAALRMMALCLAALCLAALCFGLFFSPSLLFRCPFATLCSLSCARVLFLIPAYAMGCECLGGEAAVNIKRHARHHAVTLLRHVSFLPPPPRCSAPLSPPPTRRAFQAALPAVTNKKEADQKPYRLFSQPLLV